MTSARPPRDAGAATVLLLALSAVLAVCSSALVSLAATGAARARAESAADLAALAAAAAVQQGGDPCGRAEAVARAEGARLTGCAVGGEQVRVVVSVVPPGPLAALGLARGAARAGPAGPPGTATRRSAAVRAATRQPPVRGDAAPAVAHPHSSSTDRARSPLPPDPVPPAAVRSGA